MKFSFKWILQLLKCSIFLSFNYLYLYSFVCIFRDRQLIALYCIIHSYSNDTILLYIDAWMFNTVKTFQSNSLVTAEYIREPICISFGFILLLYLLRFRTSRVLFIMIMIRCSTRTCTLQTYILLLCGQCHNDV